jgi:trigger factor
LKVPGFRKGKVPRQIIDARVGPDVVRQEALKEALPDLYRRALDDEGIEAVAPPDIEVVDFEPGSDIVFTALVDVRPEVVVPDLASLRIEAPPSEVTDEDVNEQLERLQDRFAELETVGREARRGDFALIDIKGYQHDQPVEGAESQDLLYEIGSRTGPPKLDAELEGTRPGAILKFNDTIPEGADLAGQEISFTVLVKEIKTKKLPSLDDEFAKTVGEFDTLEELKEDLRSQLGNVKLQAVHEQIRARALEALVDASELDPPEKLVEGEFAHRLEHFEADLKAAGLTMSQYAEQAQSTELEIRRDFRTNAHRAVKAELLLEEIARNEGIEITEEDIGREIAMAAARAQREPGEVAQELVKSGQLSMVAADIMRRKALDRVIEEANVVNGPEGQAEESNE